MSRRRTSRGTASRNSCGRPGPPPFCAGIEYGCMPLRWNSSIASTTGAFVWSGDSDSTPGSFSFASLTTCLTVTSAPFGFHLRLGGRAVAVGEPAHEDVLAAVVAHGVEPAL